MQYYLMGALAFSAVIEPAALYVATYKLRDPRDSRLLIQTILASFAAFDIFHAAAAIAGSGVQATSGRVQHLFGDQLLGSVVVVAGSICLVLPHGKQVERILKIHVALAPRDVSRQCISSDKSTYVEEVT
jgi:hypothetical protein